MTSKTPTGRFYAAFHRWSHSACQIHNKTPTTSRYQISYSSTSTISRQPTRTSSARRLQTSNVIVAQEYSDYQSPSPRTRPPKKPHSFDQKAFANSIEDVSNQAIQKKSSKDIAGEHLRRLMREMPHSVVVITACQELDGPLRPGKSENDLLSPYYEDFLGVTVSSMTTVTLGPPPAISFNLKIISRTLRGITYHQKFHVHCLRANAYGVEVAEAFVRSSHAEAFKRLTEAGRWVGLGLEAQPSSAGKKSPEEQGKVAPIIHGTGIRAYLVCRVLPEKCVEVGDHMIVVAEVDEVITFQPDDSFPPHLPLLMYSDQGYHKHGARLSPPPAASADDLSQPLVNTENGYNGFSVKAEAKDPYPGMRPPDAYIELQRYISSTVDELRINGKGKACRRIEALTWTTPVPYRTYLRAVMIEDLVEAYKANPDSEYKPVITKDAWERARELQKDAETGSRNRDEKPPVRRNHSDQMQEEQVGTVEGQTISESSKSPIHESPDEDFQGFENLDDSAVKMAIRQAEGDQAR